MQCAFACARCSVFGHNITWSFHLLRHCFNAHTDLDSVCGITMTSLAGSAGNDITCTYDLCTTYGTKLTKVIRCCIYIPYLMVRRLLQLPYWGLLTRAKLLKTGQDIKRARTGVENKTCQSDRTLCSRLAVCLTAMSISCQQATKNSHPVRCTHNT